MSDDEFLSIYAMLNRRHTEIAGGGVGLRSLHAGGMILFARHTRKLIEEWEVEVARRAKASAENARREEECVRTDFGADSYDKLTPDYEHGLDFGDTMD